jgi:hypothetical protein
MRLSVESLGLTDKGLGLKVECVGLGALENSPGYGVWGVGYLSGVTQKSPKHMSKLPTWIRGSSTSGDGPDHHGGETHHLKSRAANIIQNSKGS